MAWGIFKKIARGLTKGAKWINDKIVKPIVKPVLNITEGDGEVLGRKDQ